MVMLCWFGEEVEKLIGGFAFVLLYVATGVAGWCTTFMYLRIRHSDVWEFAAKFQSGIGSSPATYGIGAFLAAAKPASCSLSSLGIPSWVRIVNGP